MWLSVGHQIGDRVGRGLRPGSAGGRHRRGAGELPASARPRAERWCLMNAVGVEVRVRVTAPAKFDSGAVGTHSQPSRAGGRASPGRAHVCPKIVSTGEGTWLKAL